MDAERLGPELFLNMLHGAEPHGFRELRALRDERRPFQQFYPVADPPDKLLVDGQQLAADSYDVYVGIAPRGMQAGGKEAVERSHVIWCDCDDEASIDALGTFQSPPSMRVASGRGQHAYWALDPPICGEDAERFNYRLQRALGSDASACEYARVLRLPGTINHKNGARVRVIDTTLEVYTADDVVGGLKDAEKIVPPLYICRGGTISDRARSDPLHAIPTRVYVEVLTGKKPGRDGKITCPFHEDWIPSLHCFDDGWHCFQCEDPKQGVGERRGGDIYHLAAWMWGLDSKRDFPQIRAQLKEVFG